MSKAFLAQLPTHLIMGRLRGLYVITTGDNFQKHVQMAQAAVDGGAAIVQLRAKNLPFRAALQAAQEIRAITHHAKVLFIVNDRVDIALAAQADGVHLGDDDMPLKDARRIMGERAIIGISAATPAEVRDAVLAGANYVGTGPVFATATKADAGMPIGLDGLRRVVENSPLPVAAIGGICLQNISDTLQNGADMACVISAISSGNNGEEMARRTRELSVCFSRS